MPKVQIKKKATKKQQQKAKVDKGDDLDQALAELAVKYPTLRQPMASSSSSVSPSENQAYKTLYSLLSVSPQHLDADAEMRKFFGAKVVSSNRTTSGPSGGAGRKHPNVTTRSTLAKPQQGWWPAKMREGLSVRLLSEDEIDDCNERHGWQDGWLPGEKLWTIEYSKKYKGVTRAFVQMVLSGDPEGLWQTLRLFPYHADTLLQLSEIYYHREEHSTAADFISRALFTYERAFLGAGSFNLTSGVNRLDFDRVENRGFFLALHRSVVDLTRRGCVRTAFEFAKLLYSLDPSTDPHGALLHLDYLAIKANVSQWLLDLWDVHSQLHDSWQKNPRLNVLDLPGWAYARALALYMKEGKGSHENSTEALKEAVKRWPMVVPLLADKTDWSVGDDVRKLSAFKIHIDARSLSNEAESITHLLAHLYVQRSLSLWKSHGSPSWFSNAVNAVASSTTIPSYSSSPFAKSAPLRSSVYRHLLSLEASSPSSLSNIRTLLGFIPSSIMAARNLSCDPLPPPTLVSSYDLSGTFFKGLENDYDPLGVRPRGRRANERLLERMIPDVDFRRQLQGFFEAHPQLARQFPGGVVHFAQMVGQFPEVLEDLMMAQVAGDGNVVMPGGMPGDIDDVEMEDVEGMEAHAQGGIVAPPFEAHRHESAEEDSEDDEDDEEDVAPLPVRMLRNVLGRFWGASGAQQQEESSDDDNDDEEQIDEADTRPHEVDPDDVD
ncbi:DUF654-domain-containing protein [Panus rudis PR-1116 ss-1]|nr:DUF654-domain-containing protein [Panus rudis PR-1116 ss-1]